MAAGRPVIAFGKGGARETVVEGITGTFFKEQNPLSLAAAVREFKSEKYNPQVIRQHALKFDTAVFQNKIREFVENSWEEFKRSL